MVEPSVPSPVQGVLVAGTHSAALAGVESDGASTKALKRVAATNWREAVRKRKDMRIS
jgi:hypothetical protein